MKVWIFSIVVHLLLLVALMWVRFVPEQKIAESVVIHTYSYTQVRPKPAFLPIAKQIVAEKIPQQSIAPAQPAVAKIKTKKSPISDSKAATAVAAIPQSTEQKSPPATSVLSPPATGTLSLADRALASVTAKASEPVTEWQQQREVVVRSSTPADSDIAPAMLKEVKTYTDGSLLVKGVHGCWKVPPTESRNGAIWLKTSTPCEVDTKVDQINDILQKRRTYADD